MSPISRAAERRRRILTRALPVAVLAVVAFIAWAISSGGGAELSAAQRFADAWERQDFAAMHEELSPKAARRYPLAQFTDDYGRAQETATVASVATGEPSAAESRGGAAAAVPVTLDTHAFGRISDRVVLPLKDDKIAILEIRP